MGRILLKSKFFEHLQKLSNYTSIYPKVYADFKNVYFCIHYLAYLTSYCISKVKFVTNEVKCQIWPLECNDSLNMQNNDIKVHIFEISVKFCVDWYIKDIKLHIVTDIKVRLGISFVSCANYT